MTTPKIKGENGVFVPWDTVPRAVHISTKRRGAFGRAHAIALLILFALRLESPAADGLREPRYDSILLAAMDKVYRMQYAEAESLLVRIPENVSARPYFAGLVCLNRFSDLGDTAALRRAEKFWERLSSDKTPPLYRGLADLQRAYAASLRGSRLRAARLAWSARGRLQSVSSYAEARAALAVFDYYRAQFLERFRFLPFVNPRSDLPLRRLDSAANDSRYLRDVLRGSVFWIRYDRNEIDSALIIADGFLARYPKNRLARQMRGDALYRGARLAEARAVYDELFREYAALRDSLPPSCIPLGYYCGAGKLACIYAGLGMRVQAAEYSARWRKADSLGFSPWLPASLRRELDRLHSSQSGH